jgi:3-keto-L-gulonate-6-phosphate decarboxylase
MRKKTANSKGKRSRQGDSDSDEEVENLDQSTTGFATADVSTAVSAVTGGNSFDMSEAVDMLTEKKVNMREPALQRIVKYMQSHRSSRDEDALANYQVSHWTVSLTTVLH